MKTAPPTTLCDPWQMALIHRLIRRGFTQARDFVKDASGRPVKRRAAVAEYLRFHLDGLHAHHSTEDELIWPALHERASMSSSLVDRMEEQHHTLGSAIEATRSALASWESSGEPSALLAGLESVSEGLTEHLTEEEREVVPLIARYITKVEWENHGKVSFSKFRPDQRFTAMGEMQAAASPDEAAKMLADLPSPIRMIWRFIGKRKYDKLMAAVRG